MKTELLNKPARHFRFDSSGLLLMCLAFLLGVGSYVLIKPTFPFAANKAYEACLIVNLDYRVFGCILFLLLVQLTAFSVIGTVLLPVLNYAFGLLLSMSLATIMPVDKLNVIFIAKAFPAVLVFVFSAMALSCSSAASAKRLYAKMRSDRRFKAELVKTLVLGAAFIILSVIGVSDINMIS